MELVFNFLWLLFVLLLLQDSELDGGIGFLLIFIDCLGIVWGLRIIVEVLFSWCGVSLFCWYRCRTQRVLVSLGVLILWRSNL